MKYERVCEYCGSSFLSSWENSKYCSKECSTKARYEAMSLIVSKDDGKPNKCNMLTCMMWNGKLENRCDALTKIPPMECKFFKTREQYKKEVARLKGGK